MATPDEVVTGLALDATDRETFILNGDLSQSFARNESLQIERYATRFRASGIRENEIVGIAGVLTPAENLPSGAASFVGDTSLVVQDGQDTISLAGIATIAADFSGGAVTTTLSNLSGEITDGISFDTSVNNVGTIKFSDSTLENSNFTGGDLEIVTSLFEIGSNANLEVLGGFFGPDTQEVGGLFLIDGGTAGGVKISGDFAGTR